MSTNAEILRAIANLVRVGTLHDVDYAAARARVQIGDLVTAWLPWIAPRAGNDRDWSAPELGEQVLIVSPGGDLAQGVILSGLYSDAHPAPADRATVRRAIFADGAVIEYDRAAGHLKATGITSAELQASDTVTVDAGGDVAVTSGGTLNAQATAAANIKAPLITLDGDVDITGLASMLAGFAATGDAGGGNVGTIDGSIHAADTVTADVDVLAAGKSGAHHTHLDPQGGSVGEPQ